MKNVTVHIKAAVGLDRTEVWPESKLSDVEDGTVKDNVAYILSHLENGKEVFVVTQKHIWEVYDEILDYITGSGSDEYPQLLSFTNKALHSVSTLFEQYIPIEKAMYSQKLGANYPYIENLDLLEGLSAKFDRLVNIIEGPITMLSQGKPTTSTEMTIHRSLLTISLFATLTSQCIVQMRIIMTGLYEKTQGKKYGMLTYRRDTKEFKKYFKMRLKLGEKLNHSKDEINALLRD